MKKFNRRKSNGHHGSKRREQVQDANHFTWIAHIHSYTYRNSYNHVVRGASSAITEFGVDFVYVLKVPEVQSNDDARLCRHSLINSKL